MMASRRLSASLLVLMMIALGCDLGAACAMAVTVDAGCCCPVEGPSPCMESGDLGDSPMAPDREASLETGKPAPAALMPSGSVVFDAASADRHGSHPAADRADRQGRTAVHVLCCVYLC